LAATFLNGNAAPTPQDPTKAGPIPLLPAVPVIARPLPGMTEPFGPIQPLGGPGIFPLPVAPFGQSAPKAPVLLLTKG